MAGIFKAYDIRGIYQEQLTEELTYKIGLGLASQVYKPGDKILVSCDARTHSPVLFEQLILGLRDGGCNVLSMGLAATPMNYWANLHYQVQGSVMLTASHNSAKYNGLKISRGQAVPVSYSTGINLVEQAINSNNLPKASTQGTFEELNNKETISEYINSQAEYVSTQPNYKKLKLAVDCANGMGGLFIKEFTDKFPWIELVELYCDIDCTFPNHEADPLKVENLQDLCKLVKEHNCDFGVSLDGDADRAVFVDNIGLPVSSDIMTALIAENYLKNNSSAETSKNIGYDLRSSMSVKEAVLKNGGTPFRTKVGHSNIKQQMREDNIIFAGELSGHFYYKELGYTDSALMSLIQVINIWQASDLSLNKLTQEYIKYFASGEINYKVQDVQETINKIKSHYTSHEQDELDGLTVTGDSWWFNLRASNTEPLLRLNLEANTQELSCSKLKEVEELISASGTNF